MPADHLAKTPGVVTPWGSERDAFLSFVSQRLPFDALLLAVFDEDRPQIDEVLALHGIPAARVERWCERGLNLIPLFGRARDHGAAAAAPADADDPDLAKLGHVMLHVLPEPPVERRLWCLLTAQRQRPYSQQEQRVGGLLLQQWQVAFHQAHEPVVGRLLLGHDHRVILADLWTRMQMLHHPEMLGQLVETIQPVIRQRWGEADDTVGRDAAIELARRPYWVRFHDGVPAELPGAGRRWYLELHPLEPGELPAVGVLPDDRVARAIGYIHDRFHESPSLSDIAEAAHVSPFHFHRLFTRQVGVSPKQYLQGKQLQVARWLLRATRLPIGAIAQQAGFSSHGHFTSTFHRIVGVSPSDYREGKTPSPKPARRARRTGRDGPIRRRARAGGA